MDAVTISTKTCQAVIDGFRDRDFSGWEVWGNVKDGLFLIALNDDLCLKFDPHLPAPFVLDIRGAEFSVRDVEWHWDITINLGSWNVTVRRTT